MKTKNEFSDIVEAIKVKLAKHISNGHDNTDPHFQALVKRLRELNAEKAAYERKERRYWLPNDIGGIDSP